MTADYTFVNERVAKHYGIPNVYGSQFRRVPVTRRSEEGSARAGQHPHGHVARRSNLAGGARQVDPGQPARHAAAAAAARRAGAQGKQGRRQAALAARAHGRAPIEPGVRRRATRSWIRWASRSRTSTRSAPGGPRTTGAPIDASGQLADGTAIDGVVSLRRALLRRPETFVSTMTEKMLTYALGRGLSSYDMPAVRAIVRDAAGRDYRFSSLVLGIVNSVPFQMRTKARTDRSGRLQPAANVRRGLDSYGSWRYVHYAGNRCRAGRSSAPREPRWRCRCSSR